MANARQETAFDGTRYQNEIEALIRQMESGYKGTGDPNAVKRMREYLELGPQIIDSSEEHHHQTVRYLLVTLASLVDQNAMYTQFHIGKAAHVLKLPLWVCAIALVLLVLQGL